MSRKAMIKEDAIRFMAASDELHVMKSGQSIKHYAATIVLGLQASRPLASVRTKNKLPETLDEYIVGSSRQGQAGTPAVPGRRFVIIVGFCSCRDWFRAEKI